MTEAQQDEMSKTQVTKEVESKSQLDYWDKTNYSGCQRPKLLKKLKANHNRFLCGLLLVFDVKDPSY